MSENGSPHCFGGTVAKVPEDPLVSDRAYIADYCDNLGIDPSILNSSQVEKFKKAKDLMLSRGLDSSYL